MDLLPIYQNLNSLVYSEKLLHSMGFFWNKIFGDRPTIRGLTRGQAESLLQEYQRLFETVDNYAIKSVPVFRTQLWKPLLINIDDVQTQYAFFGDFVFGVQPESDLLNTGSSFEFGGKCNPVNKDQRIFPIDATLKGVSIIANNLVDPDFMWVSGLNFKLQYPYIRVHHDILNDSSIARFKDGDITYLVLWAYTALVDESDIASAYSRMFNIDLESTEEDKVLLSTIVELISGGPTAKNIKAVFSAAMNVPVATTHETVMAHYVVDERRIIVTDKNCYKFDAAHSSLHLTVGTQLHPGDTLCDAFQYFDVAESGAWWRSELVPEHGGSQIYRTYIPAALFDGHLPDGLWLQNTGMKATWENGAITFPLEDRGLNSAATVSAFNEYLNKVENLAKVKEALGLSDITTSVFVNPLDFVFTNFFKFGSILLRFKITDWAQVARLSKTYISIKPYLPSYLWILFYIEMPEQSETKTLQNSEDALVTMVNPLVEESTYDAYTLIDDGTYCFRIIQ